MEPCKENNIEFITGEDTTVVTFSQRKFISKIKRLASKYPDEVKWLVENKDGSICAKIPLSWIKISHPKTMPVEQREAARDRLLEGRKKKRGNNE